MKVSCKNSRNFSDSSQCLDSSSSSSASDVNLSQDCPAFQMVTLTSRSGEASLVPKSSFKASKRLLEPTVKVTDNLKKEKKAEKETEEDKRFLLIRLLLYRFHGYVLHQVSRVGSVPEFSC